MVPKLHMCEIIGMKKIIRGLKKTINKNPARRKTIPQT